DWQAVDEALARVHRDHGIPDVVIANAGISVRQLRAELTPHPVREGVAGGGIRTPAPVPGEVAGVMVCGGAREAAHARTGATAGETENEHGDLAVARSDRWNVVPTSQ
ncbi:hypothetical protein AB0K09_28240, partial [Streptomyces sp. NPDC049577]